MIAMFNGQPVFGPAGPDGNPIGTIISYMGLTAPKDYLICDGTVYNMADYQELAQFFKTQFGAANYFGGDGITTFSIPDLRGEFLRGAGTATRNTGSGSNVGVHQDPSKIPRALITGNGDSIHYYLGDNSDWPIKKYLMEMTGDKDWYKTQPYDVGVTFTNKYTLNPANGISHFSVRPTNTAILYCIKAIEVSSFSGGLSEDVYSTEEIQIGTWIEGKPLYRISYPINTGNSNNAVVQVIPKDFYVVKIYGFLVDGSNSHVPIPGMYMEHQISVYVNDGNIYVNADAFYQNYPGVITIEYTKTTD